MSSKTYQNIPQWVETGSKDTITAGMNLSAPYIYDRGSMTAGLNGLHEQAFNMASSHARNSEYLAPAIRRTAIVQNQQPHSPRFADMQSAFNPVDRIEAPTLPQQNINAYQNPYTNAVIGGMQSDMARAHRQEQSGINARVARAGAFGGSRHALMNSEATGNYYDRLGNLSNQIRSQAFQNAQSMAQQDMARQMQAQVANQNSALQQNQQRMNAMDMENRWRQQGFTNRMANNDLQLRTSNQLGQLMNLKNSLMMNNVGVLSGLGDLAQQTEQNQLNEPWKALEFRANMLSGNPYSTWTTEKSGTSGWDKVGKIFSWF